MYWSFIRLKNKNGTDSRNRFLRPHGQPCRPLRIQFKYIYFTIWRANNCGKGRTQLVEHTRRILNLSSLMENQSLLWHIYIQQQTSSIQPALELNFYSPEDIKIKNHNTLPLNTINNSHLQYIAIENYKQLSPIL